MSTSQSNQRLIAIAIVVIIALLGINGYLFYNIVNQNKLLKTQNAELIEAEKLRGDLEQEYTQALADLDILKSNNAELNAIIESQKDDLKNQKDRIAGLIRNERDLENARSEIARLKQLGKKYVAEIAKLREENEMLSKTNMALQEETRELMDVVEEKNMENEELVSARAALVSEKETLQQEKDNLKKIVDLASVVKVEDISVNGFKIRNSGKEAKKRRAKAVDGLKICFTTAENTVVPAGEEVFYIRIVNPIGETLAIESEGSGVLALTHNDEQVRYTKTKRVEYTNAQELSCLSWKTDQDFDPGDYVVEIYNKGVLSGRSSFTLK